MYWGIILLKRQERHSLMLYENAISVTGVSKSFYSFDRSSDRLKQALLNKYYSIIGKEKIRLFKEHKALNNISFEIKKGETVGIVGQNGSGKSTLLQIITGILTPNSGDVLVRGRIAALLELGSGFNFDFTGKENIYLNASILGLTKKEVDEKYNDIISFADIGDFINEPVKSYSSGMMVRLAFAVAINIEPDILIIDEALAVGDELFQRKCYSKIEEIKSKGSTILFVSHSGPTIVELCDRAILIDSGDLLKVGTAKDIIQLYHKLIYSPQDKKENIRQEIIKEEHKYLEDNSKLSNVHFLDSGEYFDPSLVVEYPFSYENSGAKIYGVEIKTLDNISVNNLIRGKRYKYSYKVHFSEDSKSIRCGMLIKTIKGVELGGAISSNYKKAITKILANDILSVEFEFECNLTPGTYFLNAGVLGMKGGYETYLHRLIDAALFKVIPENELGATCIVDFKCKSSLRVLNDGTI